MSAKLNNIELNGEFMVMPKEESHRRSFLEEIFLEILQNSQENTCARVVFLMKSAEADLGLLQHQRWSAL